MSNIYNSEEIETVYNLTEATEILTNRAIKAAKKLLIGTFKDFMQSPIFFQRIFGIFLVIISVVAIQYYKRVNTSEPLFGFLVIMLCGIYLVFENDHRENRG